MPAANEEKSNLRNVYLSAIILAIANMGDAFLYAWLPSNYFQIGFSAFWVGIILSVNRIVRFFLNGRIAWLLSRRGFKTVMLVSVALSFISTISYGFMRFVPLWILMRILWGIAFSVLRLSSTMHAVASSKKGMAIGISKSIAEFGPVLALLLGPALLNHGGHEVVFTFFALLNVLGMFMILKLIEVKSGYMSKIELRLSRPSKFDLLVFVHSFIADGVMVISLGKFFVESDVVVSENVLGLIGLLLGYRRVSMFVLSPISGIVSDRLGFEFVFISTLMASLLGLLILLSGFPIVGVLVIFSASSLNSSAAIGVSLGSGISDIKSVSDNSTWRDIGTALGAFSGSLMLSVIDSSQTVLISILFYCLGLLFFWRGKWMIQF